MQHNFFRVTKNRHNSRPGETYPYVSLIPFNWLWVGIEEYWFVSITTTADTDSCGNALDVHNFFSFLYFDWKVIPVVHGEASKDAGHHEAGTTKNSQEGCGDGT